MKLFALLILAVILCGSVYGRDATQLNVPIFVPLCQASCANDAGYCKSNFGPEWLCKDACCTKQCKSDSDCAAKKMKCANNYCK